MLIKNTDPLVNQTKKMKWSDDNIAMNICGYRLSIPAVDGFQPNL